MQQLDRSIGMGTDSIALHHAMDARHQSEKPVVVMFHMRVLPLGSLDASFSERPVRAT